MPKISIIVPVYNAEKYLTYCINSILNQSFRHFELLLIDDGSKDSSLSICNKFANIDDRVKTFHQNNSGVCATRNKGLELAKGDFVCFCDQDDWLERGALATLYNLAVNTNSDITCGSIKQIWPHCNIDEKLPDKKYISNVNANNLIELNKIGASIWGKLYKKELLEKYNLRLTNVTTREDYIFFYNVLEKANVVSTTSRIIYNYNKLESDTGCSNPKNDYCECSLIDYDAQVKACNKWSNDVDTINIINKQIIVYHIIDILNEYLLFKYDDDIIFSKLKILIKKFKNNIDFNLLSKESIRVLGFDASSYIDKEDTYKIIDMYNTLNNDFIHKSKAYIFNIIKQICYKNKSKKYKNQ